MRKSTLAIITTASAAALSCAAAAQPALELQCSGETIHLSTRGRTAVSDTLKHSARIYVSGPDAVVVWENGTTRHARSIQTASRYILLFPDPPMPRGGRVVRKEASIDRVTGVFTEVTTVESGRESQVIRHTGQCEPVQPTQDTKF